MKVMQGFSINSSNTFPSNNSHRIVIKFLVIIFTTVMYFLVRIVIIVIKRIQEPVRFHHMTKLASLHLGALLGQR